MEAKPVTVRAVDEELVTRALSRVVWDALQEAGVEDEPTEQVVELLRDWLRDYLGRQRRSPRLIGATKAAGMLGVQPPHLARLRRQGRMPEPIPVDGTNPVYVYDDIAELAETLRAEREARRQRQEVRST